MTAAFKNQKDRFGLTELLSLMHVSSVQKSQPSWAMCRGGGHANMAGINEAMSADTAPTVLTYQRSHKTTISRRRARSQCSELSCNSNDWNV